MARGSFPRTIASGDRERMVIYDPVALIDIERYQKVDIHAGAPAELYPAGSDLTVAANAGFLRECVRRIATLEFVDRDSGLAYLRAHRGCFEVLDAALLARVLEDAERAAALGAITPLATRRNTLS